MNWRRRGDSNPRRDEPLSLSKRVPWAARPRLLKRTHEQERAGEYEVVSKKRPISSRLRLPFRHSPIVVGEVGLEPTVFLNSHEVSLSSVKMVGRAGVEPAVMRFSVACLTSLATYPDKWRRRRDSNPRGLSDPARLAGERLRPLGHASVVASGHRSPPTAHRLPHKSGERTADSG